MARLPGAASLFVNGRWVSSEILRRRGFQGVPVQPSAGTNQILVTGIEGGFELEFWKPRTRMVLGTWDIRHPRIDDDHSIRFSADLELPLFQCLYESGIASTPPLWARTV
jgi:hypothetical protein